MQFVLKTPTQEILDCAPVEKLADRVYQVFGRQALDELMEIPPTEAPVRSAITEPPLEAGRAGGDDSRDRIHLAARSAAHQSQRDLHFRESAAGARPAAAARDQRGVPQHHAAGSFSGRAAVSRFAVPGSGRERASGENRGALPASAVRPRFHARRAAPRAFDRAADSGISRGARCGSGAAVAVHGDSTADTRRRRRMQSYCARRTRAHCRGRRAPRFPTSFASSAAIAEDFELSGAPDRPIRAAAWLSIRAQR